MEVSKGKRFGAILIDIIIACIINAIFAFISGATGIGSLFIIGYVISYAYIFFREQVLGGQSVGHKVMGYKVVKEDSSSIKGDFLASFLRNITLLILIPDLVLLIIGKPRLGDMISKTKVVNA